MPRRASCLIDPEVFKFMKAEAVLHKKRVGDRISEILWDHVEKTKDELFASKLAGTGGYRAAKAANRMTKAEKLARLQRDEAALKVAGLDNL